MTRHIAHAIAAALIGLLSVSCVPNLSRAKMAATEVAAVSSIKTIHIAQVQYSSDTGHFATSLAELANILGPELASGQKNGYKFTLTPHGTGYQITAVPVTFNVTGSRTFFSDETMVVRQNRGAEPATANSPEFGQ